MAQLEDFVIDQYQHRASVVRAQFAAEAPRLARACHEMAERFARGGRILAFGMGPAATDASHISVEFVHPVIVGKRALPAIALPNDGPTALGLAAEDSSSVFARQIDVLGRPDDIAIGLALAPDDASGPAIAAGIKQAAAKGIMTIALTGPTSRQRSWEADWLFSCEDPDPFVVQEVHETGYHMLWELVHVFFEHKGLLKGRDAGPVHDSGASSFLYPFLAEAETNLDAVLAEVQGSIQQKAEDVISIRVAKPDQLVDGARLLARQFGAGGKLLAFGNGGSATDAQDFVTDLMAPPPGMRPRPALSLTNEEAVVTAVGNDVGYDNIYARQVIAFGQPGDIAFAVSTSGGSRNVLAALEEARRRKMTTFGLAGYGGGPMVARKLVDHCVTIDFEYIPRIQEAQATQYHVLRHLVEMV
ncbi:MAG TPA: SIS domain-containing protein [Actinomycetota bacterium]|nr:SIS domain-containing protein [Actinomycetota bacterium]